MFKVQLSKLLCRKAGITRKKPDRESLSKREMEKIIAYINEIEMDHNVEVTDSDRGKAKSL